MKFLCFLALEGKTFLESEAEKYGEEKSVLWMMKGEVGGWEGGARRRVVKRREGRGEREREAERGETEAMEEELKEKE